MTLQQTKESWTDNVESHVRINEAFIDGTNADNRIKKHRDWIESNGMGMGERSFQYLWKLLVAEMPKGFTFLEIGVYCGQILSLIRLLSPTAKIYGVSPMDIRGGEVEADYFKYVENVHDALNIKKDYTIIQGMSQSLEVLQQVATLNIDLLLIDGGHSYNDVCADIQNYLPLVNKNGYVVFDDACNGMHMPNNYFHGIESTTNAVKDTMPQYKDFEFQFNVMHNRVYKRVK